MTDVVTFRPEIINAERRTDLPQVEKTLSWFERVYRIGFVRKAFIL